MSIESRIRRLEKLARMRADRAPERLYHELVTGGVYDRTKTLRENLQDVQLPPGVVPFPFDPNAATSQQNSERK